MLADFTMTELMLVIGPIAAAGGTAIAVLWNSNNKGWEARVALLVAQLLSKDEDIKSYKQMNTEAFSILRLLANEKDVAEGKVPIPKALAVVAEHSSEPTEKQMETAEIATQRAELVELNKRLGMEPRTHEAVDSAARRLGTEPHEAAGGTAKREEDIHN